MAISGASVTSGRPSARARAFCSWMAWRTEGMPPLSSCSATGSCSGRSSASAALRKTVDVAGRRSPRSRPVPSRPPGRARAGPRRAPPASAGTSGAGRPRAPCRAPVGPRGLASPSARGPRPSPSVRGPRPDGRRGAVTARRRRSRHDGACPLPARTTLTSGPFCGVPRISIRSTGLGLGLALGGEERGDGGAVQGHLHLGPQHASPPRCPRGRGRRTPCRGAAWPRRPATSTWTRPI